MYSAKIALQILNDKDLERNAAALVEVIRDLKSLGIDPTKHEAVQVIVQHIRALVWPGADYSYPRAKAILERMIESAPRKDADVGSKPTENHG